MRGRLVFLILVFVLCLPLYAAASEPATNTVSVPATETVFMWCAEVMPCHVTQAELVYARLSEGKTDDELAMLLPVPWWSQMYANEEWISINGVPAWDE